MHLFGFIGAYQKRTYKEQDPVNIEAAELVGQLHDKLKEIGYSASLSKKDEIKIKNISGGKVYRE